MIFFAGCNLKSKSNGDGSEEDTRPWSVRMTDSEIKRNPEAWMLDFAKRPNWSYCAGMEREAFMAVGDRYNIPAYFEYVKHFTDSVVTENGDILVYKKDEYNIDYLNSGKMLFDVYNKTHEEKYKKALYNMRDQLTEHPRTKEGGFWHKKRYPHQMWLDGLYMGSPFYAEFCATFNEPEYFSDITKQFILVARYTYDPVTGLFRHGWDESRRQKWADPETGRSAHTWGRAQGWFAMALVDALDFIPEGTEGRDSMITILNTVVEGINKYRDPETGLWYQVIDKSGDEGNYLEATGSSMFIYTMLKASEKGYIDQSYNEIARKDYESFIKIFVKDDGDGMYSITSCCAVAGLGGDDRRDGSYEYYLSEPVRDNDPKAMGPFIFTSLMIEAK
jgi:unsaturated rhamnogalacturonyl hydrolase